ncbi:MAG: hypothetical protein ABSF80_05300 [Chitinispirillaceae bacterium]|jgi:hypothetical protein
MSVTFTPVETLDLFCRFCEKVTIGQLDRSIAGNGRTIDKNSTFEYYCTKCFKTACFSGNDLLEQQKSSSANKQPREYAPHDHYCIGERIYHKKFKEPGLIVNKDSGTPSRLLVQFNKAGLKKLVQDM